MELRQAGVIELLRSFDELGIALSSRVGLRPVLDLDDGAVAGPLGIVLSSTVGLRRHVVVLDDQDVVPLKIALSSTVGLRHTSLGPFTAVAVKTALESP